jgi:putative FmdB family regulatory protein
MATYEYVCVDNHVTTQVRGMGEPSVAQVRCQTCGKDSKRMYSSPAIQFKGSGFYSSRTR